MTGLGKERVSGEEKNEHKQGERRKAAVQTGSCAQAKQGDKWRKNRVRGRARGGELLHGGRKRARGRGSEREEGLFVDHWQIMGSLGQT